MTAGPLRDVDERRRPTFRRQASVLLAVAALCSGPPGAAAPPRPSGAVKIDVQGTQRAAVIPDTTCPVVVRPYTLADNLDDVVGALRTGALAATSTFLGKLVSGQKATFDRNDALAATKLLLKRSDWMPMDVEVAYGERQHQQMQDDILDRDSKAGARRYAVADRMLHEILAGVGQPFDYDFRIFVLRSDAQNALALPGGFVYVDDGLLADEKSRAKAYFAIAHEIAHVLQRHETQELQSMAIDSVTSASELVALVKGRQTGLVGLIDHVKVEKQRFTRHHIDEELVADSCATRILARALPSDRAVAAALLAFINDLQPASPAPPAPVPTNDVERLAASVTEIVDSPIQRHPNDADRVRNLQAMYADVVATPVGSAPAKAGKPAAGRKPD